MRRPVSTAGFVLWYLFWACGCQHAEGSPKDAVAECVDKNKECKAWAAKGECDANPGYMLVGCQKSCQTCPGFRPQECDDKRKDCLRITKDGACVLNVSEMLVQCPGTCRICGPGDPCIADISKDPGSFPEPGALDDMFRRILTSEATQKYLPRSVSEDPWLVVLDNFMTDEEVKTLLDNLDGTWARSSAGGLVGEDKVMNARTSEQIWCGAACENKAPGAKLMLQRVEEITGASRSRYEDMQILKYQPGQQYTHHNDFISGQNRLACGPRLMTFFVYLSDSPGADTRFPKMNHSVPCRKGTAAIWPSVQTQNVWLEDGRAEHQGLPPTDSTKYAANVWIHQFDFRRLNNQHCFMADRQLRHIKEKKKKQPSTLEL